MNGFDEKGRPLRAPGKTPSQEGTLVYPGNRGGTSWYSPSYSPRTGIFYVSAWDNYSSIYVKFPDEYREGHTYMGGTHRSATPDDRYIPQNVRKDEEGYGAVRAIDPKTGEKKWDFKMADVTDAGILTTASDLLFSGGRDGYFFALDARTGTLLWKVAVGGTVSSGPMTYLAEGRQYVAVSAGNCLFTFALRSDK